MNSEKGIEDIFRETCALGDEDGVRKIINMGININSQHPINGWTGLHWAVKRGHASIVRLLLDNGANPTLPSLYGETPQSLCKDKIIKDMLPADGNSDYPADPPSKSPLPITPNYLSSPMLAPKVLKQENMDNKNLSHELEMSPRRNANREIVLKIRIADSEEEDFIEIEIPHSDMSYDNVLKTCCDELHVPIKHVLKLRKLPNTIVRKDKDVSRFENFQELELVLHKHFQPNKMTPKQDNKSYDKYGEDSPFLSQMKSSSGRNSSYSKNGTILY